MNQPQPLLQRHIDESLAHAMQWLPQVLHDTQQALLAGTAPALRQAPKGQIAEVRIWSVARAQEDIRRTMHVALDEPLPGLVGSWHLTDHFRDKVGKHDGTGGGNGLSFNGPVAPPRPPVAAVDTDFNRLPVALAFAANAHVPSLNRVIMAGGSAGGTITNQIFSLDTGSGAARAIGTGNIVVGSVHQTPWMH